MPNCKILRVCSSCTQSGLNDHSIKRPRWLTRRTRHCLGVTTMSSGGLGAAEIDPERRWISSQERAHPTPSSKNAMPATKLTVPMKIINTMRLSDRCGVTRGIRGRSKLRIKVVACDPSRISIPRSWPKSSALRVQKGRRSVRQGNRERRRSPKRRSERRRNHCKTKSPGRRPRSARPSAVSARPIRSRRASSSISTPITLLVAVVLSAQATDAGVNKATRALFAVADTPQKMLELGEEQAARATSRPSGSIATRRRTSSRSRRS